MKKMFVLMAFSFFFLTACGSSEKVKDEEYQFAGGLKLLDIPPNLTNPDKNLVMEIPKPSLKACEMLMEADKKFKIEKAKKDAEAKVKAEQEKQNKPAAE